MIKKILATTLLFLLIAVAQNITPKARPRCSDLGLKVGVLPTGPLDAITDVAGVRVGHTTIIRGDDLHTGVTAIQEPNEEEDEEEDDREKEYDDDGDTDDRLLGVTIERVLEVC